MRHGVKQTQTATLFSAQNSNARRGLCESALIRSQGIFDSSFEAARHILLVRSTTYFIDERVPRPADVRLCTVGLDFRTRHTLSIQQFTPHYNHVASVIASQPRHIDFIGSSHPSSMRDTQLRALLPSRHRVRRIEWRPTG